jgi:hypothetical protein
MPIRQSNIFFQTTFCFAGIDSQAVLLQSFDHSSKFQMPQQITLFTEFGEIHLTLCGRVHDSVFVALIQKVFDSEGGFDHFWLF